MSVTPVEEVVQRFLPWAGGMAGASLLYFLIASWLNWQASKRLREIELSLAEVKGALMVLKRRGK